MSRIDELIERLCPDGVEYRALADVATVTRGGNFQKKHFVERGFPCIHYGQIYTRYGLHATETISFVSDEIAAKSKKAQPGDVVMAVTSENIEDVCKCVTWLGGSEVAISGHTAIIHHGQNPKYMTYYFHSSAFDAQKRKLAHGTKVIEVTPDHLLNVRIPVPPMEVQQEIVRVLDSFAELEAELEARKAQYAYYQHLLLLADNEAEMHTFSDYCASMNTGPFGSSVHKSDYTSDGCPIVNPADIVGGRIVPGKRVSMSAEQRLARYRLYRGDIVIGRRGEMGRITVVDDESEGYLCGTGCFFVRMNELALPRYWKHFFGTSYAKDYLEAHAVGGTMKNLNLGILGRMQVPVPPLEEQERIVAILDKFDTLVNDISQGIPAEIEARRKQYAYYRDKLLAFKEKIA